MNFDQVLELIKTVSNSELTTFQYEEGNQKIVMHTGNVVYNNIIGDAAFGAAGMTGGIPAGGSAQAGNGIPAGGGAQAGSGIPAGGGAQAGSGIPAGGSAQAGSGIPAGGSAQAGSGIPAGGSATADTGVSAGNDGAGPGLSGSLVCSPLVGRFFTAPSEDAEVFVKVGDTVKKGQVLAIVEAMKLMNEIESDYDGVVAEVLAENGQSVEFGQPLFRIA